MPPRARTQLVVVGGSGFIGTAVRKRASDIGLDVVGVAAPRLSVPWGHDPLAAAGTWCADEPEGARTLEASMRGATTVVNAAGLALPGANVRSAALWGANAVLPPLLALLASRAGVLRLVHVSSAAVQGRRQPLDESAAVQPLTPYAEAKAAGESAALAVADTDLECIIYRPTSVQGPDRGMTQQIIRLCRLPAVPVAGNGGATLPIAHIENVAAGIMHVACAQSPPAIVVQPSEGLTSRRLFELLGARRILDVPPWAFRLVLRALVIAGSIRPGLIGYTRRLELLAFGQNVEATALHDMGFTITAGEESYRALLGDRPR